MKVLMCVSVYAHVYVCVHVCMYLCVHPFMCVCHSPLLATPSSPQLRVQLMDVNLQTGVLRSV